MNAMNDKALQEQLDIDRANDVSPLPKERKPVKRLFPDWFYGNTKAANKLAKEQCGIPRDRDFVDPEVLKGIPVGCELLEEQRICRTTMSHELTFTSEGKPVEKFDVNWHCPQCETNDGTQIAYHPECYRQQQEDTLFKRTWMVVGGVIVILTGVAWLVLK